MLARALHAYRASGADLGARSPARAHGVPFEGYFWRLFHPGTGVAVVALSAACRGASGPWGLVTLAAYPGAHARSALTGEVHADPHAFGIRAGSLLRGDAASISVDLGPDDRLEATLHDAVEWPRRPFGALGPAHLVPRLAQYWHPVVLAARVRGSARVGGRELDLDGASAYVEKNWGHGFPGRWWWGQAGAFASADDVSVAFAGGHVGLLGADVAPTAVVIRLGSRVIAAAPPVSRTWVSVTGGEWRLRTRGPRLEVEIEGDGAGHRPHELLVPVPDERRAEPRSRQHLAGRLALTVRRGGRTLFAGESALAGLELGEPL